VPLTSLDHRVIEDPYDRGTQRLAAVDADEDRPAGVPAPVAQQIGGRVVSSVDPSTKPSGCLVRRSRRPAKAR